LAGGRRGRLGNYCARGARQARRAARSTRTLGVMKLPALLVPLLAVSSLSATEITPWPPQHKAAAIAGCRASIADHTERDYLKRSQLKELPADFREKAAPAMEPFLAVCDCMFDHFERMWTFEYYVSHPYEVQAQLKELMTGACAVKAAEPVAKPDLDPPTPNDA
jgi:hypothetical protein